MYSCAKKVRTIKKNRICDTPGIDNDIQPTPMVHFLEFAIQPTLDTLYTFAIQTSCDTSYTFAKQASCDNSYTLS